jgi:hypothetical protein
MSSIEMKLQSAYRAQTIATSIKTSIPMIKECLNKIKEMGIDSDVNDFETVFETLDVKASSMNSALEGVHGSSIGSCQVDELMNQLRDQQTNLEHNSAASVRSGQISTGM